MTHVPPTEQPAGSPHAHSIPAPGQTNVPHATQAPTPKEKILDNLHNLR
jgi:hypothetical protein